MLNGLLVVQRKSVPGDMYREIGEIENKNQNRYEEQSLRETIFGGSLDEIAGARDQPKSQRQDEI